MKKENILEKGSARRPKIFSRKVTILNVRLLSDNNVVALINAVS
jgi:hypothetical protein